LRQYPLGEAIDRFSQALRAFAAAHGATDKYHETMTVAWMLLIAERLGESRDLDWAAFRARHAGLLVSQPSIVSNYYRDETLSSARAKRTFVMPDRVPG
jgi:hypothetical protein